jgi:hypothetical protein
MNKYPEQILRPVQNNNDLTFHHRNNDNTSLAHTGRIRNSGSEPLLLFLHCEVPPYRKKIHGHIPSTSSTSTCRLHTSQECPGIWIRGSEDTVVCRAEWTRGPAQKRREEACTVCAPTFSDRLRKPCHDLNCFASVMFVGCWLPRRSRYRYRDLSVVWNRIPRSRLRWIDCECLLFAFTELKTGCWHREDIDVAALCWHCFNRKKPSRMSPIVEGLE